LTPGAAVQRPWTSAARGAVLAPLLVGLPALPGVGAGPAAAPWAWSAGLAAHALLLGGWVGRGRAPRLAALAALLGGTALASLAVTLAPAPGRGLLLGLATLALLALLWPDAAVVSLDGDEADDPSVEVAALSAGLVGAVIVAAGGAELAGWQLAWLGAGGAMAARRALTLGFRGAAAAAGAAAVWAAAAGAGWDQLVPCLAAPLLLGVGAARSRAARGSHTSGLLDDLLGHPARLLVLSFVLLCALGALALATAPSGAHGPLRFVDAAFTAVSAACVTGLGVVDTARDLSVFGQLVVLLLIQVGGLGIMTFASAAFMLLGRRMSLAHESTAVGLLGAAHRADLAAALQRVVGVTLGCELAGAAALFAAFLRAGEPVGTALWRAVFTAVSAFCNAGFALQSDSLSGYATSPGVLGVVMLLITAGALGPAVVVALPDLARGRRAPLGTRLVLLSTAVLVLAPAALLLALEATHTLGGLSWGDRVVNALFQSVTLRTAGFNTVDLAAVRPATWTVMVVVMFVGGSPGSTAGGVKTTTVAVLLLAAVAAVRGRREVEVAGRRLAPDVVQRATAIALAGLGAVITTLFALQVTQDMPLEHALFEAVSALATVGLTVGGTAALDDVGKWIIMGAMFAGRVGPLTLFLALQDRGARGRFGLPVEDVAVG
jgi:trk system potassium uptake protein TrkH